jgi:uncharacterized SAM-binding protein YcdF (DUF218 family)
MNPVIVAVIKSFLLPPGILIILLVYFCYIFRDTRHRFIYYLFCFFIFSTYLISTPNFSSRLAKLIEPEEALELRNVKDAEAIVILGCNLYVNGPEYSENDDVSECTLIRLRYGAELYSQTMLPVMTCGGSVLGKSQSEADVMAKVLYERFNVETKWKENRSVNTYQNVENAVSIMKKENINKIILVTHAIHMQRAIYSFNKNNIKVYPAPTYFFSAKTDKPLLLQFIPNIKALYVSRFVAYELIGLVWHWWKHI